MATTEIAATEIASAETGAIETAATETTATEIAATETPATETAATETAASENIRRRRPAATRAEYWKRAEEASRTNFLIDKWTTMTTPPPIPEFTPRNSSVTSVYAGRIMQNLRVRDPGNGRRWIADPSDRMAAPNRRRGDPFFLRIVEGVEYRDENKSEQIDANGKYVAQERVRYDENRNPAQIFVDAGRLFFLEREARMSTYLRDQEVWRVRVQLMLLWFPPAGAGITDITTREEIRQKILEGIRAKKTYMVKWDKAVLRGDFGTSLNAIRRELHMNRNHFVEFRVKSGTEEDFEAEIARPCPNFAFPDVFVSHYTPQWQNFVEQLKLLHGTNYREVALSALENGRDNGREIEEKTAMSLMMALGLTRVDMVRERPQFCRLVKNTFW